MQLTKWLLLVFTLMTIAGCVTPEQTAYLEERKSESTDRAAMLIDGRIYIGMTDTEFSRLWERESSPQRTNSAGGITEVWSFAVDCRPTFRLDGLNRIYEVRAWYWFKFTNGILSVWTSL